MPATRPENGETEGGAETPPPAGPGVAGSNVAEPAVSVTITVGISVMAATGVGGGFGLAIYCFQIATSKKTATDARITPIRIADRRFEVGEFICDCFGGMERNQSLAD